MTFDVTPAADTNGAVFHVEQYGKGKDRSKKEIEILEAEFDVTLDGVEQQLGTINSQLNILSAKKIQLDELVAAIKKVAPKKEEKK